MELKLLDVNELAGVLFLSLFITVLIYGAIPLVLAIIKKSLITKKSYRALCFGINAIVLVISIIINEGNFNASPYILWTSLFSFLGIKILRSRNLLVESRDVADGQTYIIECKCCGYREENYFHKCPKCGKSAKRYVNSNAGLNLEDDYTYICLNCGKKLPKSVDYCLECGSKDVGVSAKEFIGFNEYKYCKKCGADIINDKEFCHVCGEKVDVG